MLHLGVDYQCVTLPSAMHPKCIRLACLKHAASVHPEPGSNSYYEPITYLPRWHMMKGQYKFVGTQSDNKYLYLALKEIDVKLSTKMADAFPSLCLFKLSTCVPLFGNKKREILLA